MRVKGILLLLLLAASLLAGQQELLKDFKALIAQGRWLEAEEYIGVLSIYYGDDPDFKQLCKRVKEEVARMPAFKRYWYYYGSATTGFIFTVALVAVFYAVALRKGN